MATIIKVVKGPKEARKEVKEKREQQRKRGTNQHLLMATHQILM